MKTGTSFVAEEKQLKISDPIEKRDGIKIPNEFSDITLPADQWLATLNIIEQYIKDGEGSEEQGSFWGIRAQIFAGRQNKTINFSQRIDVPVINTFRVHGLLVQETSGFYQLADDYDTKKQEFIAQFNLNQNTVQ